MPSHSKNELIYLINYIQIKTEFMISFAISSNPTYLFAQL